MKNLITIAIVFCLGSGAKAALHSSLVSSTQANSQAASGGSPPIVDPPAVPANPLFSSPALKAICADGVTPHPTHHGFWHLDYPSFALSDRALFATMDLRPNNLGEYGIVKVDRQNPLNYSELARFNEPIEALEFHAGKVWVLFSHKLLAIDPASGVRSLELPTTSQQLPSEAYRAHAFTWVGERLVIAHGAMGMMIFDPKSQRISQPVGLGLSDHGLLSKITSVAALDAHRALFAAESVTVTDDTFQGLVVANIDSPGSYERFPYDKASSGSISNAVVKVSGDEVVINNWGILQRASLRSMMQDRATKVSWTPIHFTVNGLPAWGELLGDVVLDQKSISACAHATFTNPTTGHDTHIGVVYNGALQN